MRKVLRQQKSYVDRSKKPIEFKEGDRVFLNVTPKLEFQGIFKMKKLKPWYFGLFQIIARVGEVAYQLALPYSLFRLYDVLHVSQLWKFIPGPFQPFFP